MLACPPFQIFKIRTDTTTQETRQIKQIQQTHQNPPKLNKTQQHNKTHSTKNPTARQNLHNTLAPGYFYIVHNAITVNHDQVLDVYLSNIFQSKKIKKVTSNIQEERTV